ncbi:MAG TPA: YdcF family protein [Flavisolibacter sp.]|nr:YdcF family protein [Flavisolibacter sp.]
MTNTITPEVLSLARKLWDYHHMDQEPAPSDCIFVLGSYDLRVAERGADLFLQGFAPLLIYSGGLGKQTKFMWQVSEAEQFAEIAKRMGVPEEAILVENRSTNTGENVRFTQQLLKERGQDPHRFLLVQKPYMERRSYATFQKQWPGKTVRVTSPQIAFEDYPTADVPIEKVITSMVGDLERVRDYPAKGFQIEQHIPDEVLDAYAQLVALGFDKDRILP